MYFVKYTNQEINNKLVNFLVVIIILYTLLVIEALNSFGLSFYYQSFLSCIFSITYFLICVSYDRVIDKNCEKVGFSVRSSRKYKFYLLFLNGILFGVSSLWAFSTPSDSQYEKQLWIINSSTNEQECNKRLYGANNWKEA